MAFNEETREGLLQEITILQLTLHLLVSIIELEIAIREEFPKETM